MSSVNAINNGPRKKKVVKKKSVSHEAATAVKSEARKTVKRVKQKKQQIPQENTEASSEDVGDENGDTHDPDYDKMIFEDQIESAIPRGDLVDTRRRGTHEGGSEGWSGEGIMDDVNALLDGRDGEDDEDDAEFVDGSALRGAHQTILSEFVPCEDAALILPHNRNTVTCVTCAPDYGLILYGDKTGKVFCYDTKNGAGRPYHHKSRTVLDPSHAGSCLSVAVSNTVTDIVSMLSPKLEHSSVDSSITSIIASAGEDGHIHLWNTKTLEHMLTFDKHRAAVTGLSFRPNTHTLYSTSADSCLRVWSCDEGVGVDKLFGHKGKINCVASMKKELCVTGGDDRVPRCWKIEKATQTEYSPQLIAVDAIATLDNQTFVTGGTDGTLALYDTFKRTPIWSHTFCHGYAHRGDGTGLESASIYASLSAQQDSVEPQTKHPALGNAISAVAALLYSDLVVSGSCDGLIRLWRYTGFVSANTRESINVQGRSLEPLRSIEVPGFINSICVTASSISVAVGKEPRLGRWTVQSAALNKILNYSLTGVTTQMSINPSVKPKAEVKHDIQASVRKAQLAQKRLLQRRGRAVSGKRVGKKNKK